MRSSFVIWRNLFLFCLGVTVATAIVIEWLSSDLWLDNERFSIFGLELFYSKREILSVLTQIRPPAKIALSYELSFDFVFVTGIFPGIASFCMMTKERVAGKTIQSCLLALALLQTVAWAFAIVSNSYLLGWVAHPVIGDELNIYHKLVAIKWLSGIAGFSTALFATLFKSNDHKNYRGKN